MTPRTLGRTTVRLHAQTTPRNLGRTVRRRIMGPTTLRLARSHAESLSRRRRRLPRLRPSFNFSNQIRISRLELMYAISV